MNGFQLLLAAEGYKDDKAWKKALTAYGVQIDSIYSAQSVDEMKDIISKYPDINAIIVSEQLKDYSVSVNDLIAMGKNNNIIIIPILNRSRKGNVELLDYIKNNLYNILFESDTVMDEAGELLLMGRAGQAAMRYAGLDMGVKDDWDKLPEKEAESIQFEKPAPERRKQPIFNERSVTIGFCGSDKEFDCTITAISAANYIAMGGYKVALIEPDFSQGTIVSKLIPSLLENDIVTCAAVDYYACWNPDNDIYSADVIIFDFSSINYEESVYLSKMKKVFICSDMADTTQSGKLQNNGSIKYSILYKEDKQGIEPLNESFEVFRECSLELKRLLKITLSSYDLDITNDADSNNVNRIKQLNTLNKSEHSGRNVWLEREAKRKNSDSNSSSLGKMLLPDHVLAQTVKPVKSEDPERTKGNKVKLADRLQKTQPSKTEPVQKITAAPKENKYVKEELAAANTFIKPDHEEKFVKENNIPAQNSNKADSTGIQEDEYYNYKVNDTSKKPYELKEDYLKESSTAAKGFLTNKADGSPSKSYTQQKNENKPSILNQWFSAENKRGFFADNAKNNDEYEYGSKNEGTDSYDDDNQEMSTFEYIEDNRNKPRKKQLINQVLCGKETIFITGLKHGCGCSHTGLSFAKYISGAYAENICICHKKGAYDLEDEGIAEYTKDTDYGSVFSNNRFIVYDCGILGELNEDQLLELKRCNIKIMVCNGDEKYLGNLSKFIRSLGNLSAEWIFAFNLVTSREKEIMIRRIMEGYKICFIPLHDSDNPSKKTSKIWDSILKRNLL